MPILLPLLAPLNLFFLVQIGYCPQFDALLEFLTVREHLQLYARIKAVPEINLNDVGEHFISHSVIPSHYEDVYPFLHLLISDLINLFDYVDRLSMRN